MDEAISLIFQGCKLAQDLEGNLQHYLSNNQLLPPPGLMLSESCDEVIKMFVSAKERLISNPPPSSYSPPPPPPQLFSIGGHGELSLQEWLKSAMAAGSGSSTSIQVPATVAATMQLDVSGSGQLLVGSSSPSSQQRPRRRKDDVEKKTMRVAAPLMGNTDAPPEDGYTWRKYGQKEILGSRFPRAYYRCTHQKMYQCPAKKQVQRHDPYTFQVTYMGSHTCHMSSTAPSIAPPAHLTAASSGAHQLSVTPPPWLDFNLGGSAGGGSSSSSSSNVNTMAAEAGSSGGDIAAAGPSYLVAEMADAMFNSGSSSTNSMEFLFSSPQDKWDPEDKKNN